MLVYRMALREGSVRVLQSRRFGFVPECQLNTNDVDYSGRTRPATASYFYLG